MEHTPPTPPPSPAKTDRPKRRQLAVVRHGERIDHVDHDWAAHAENPSDPPLTSRGLSQAAATADLLAAEEGGWDLVVSSPFTRCVQTAEPIAKACGVPLYIEPGLCEALSNAKAGGFPEDPLTGLAEPSLLEVQHPAVDATHSPVLWPTYPESRAQTLQRAALVVDRLLARFPGKRLVLVSHGLVAQGAVASLCPAWEPPLLAPPFGSVSQLMASQDPKCSSWQLVDYAANAHLTEAGLTGSPTIPYLAAHGTNALLACAERLRVPELAQGAKTKLLAVEEHYELLQKGQAVTQVLDERYAIKQHVSDTVATASRRAHEAADLALAHEQVAQRWGTVSSAFKVAAAHTAHTIQATQELRLRQQAGEELPRPESLTRAIHACYQLRQMLPIGA